MEPHKIIGEFSESTIKKYLVDRVYEKRGFTREEYIAKCKAAWEKVEYNPDYERKVIIDFSEPVILTHLLGLDGIEANFVDEGLAQLPVHGLDGETHTDIKCMVCHVAPASGRSEDATPVNDMFRCPGASGVGESLEQQLYLIALFDVLGFSNLVLERGSQALLDVYQELIARTVLNTDYSGIGRIKVGPNHYAIGCFDAPVSYTYFSDTIMLWTTRHFTHVSPFLAKCADLICEGLKIGMPLRGSVCFGEAVMHKSTNTFLGSAIVEASEIEKNQKWIGATLGSGFMLNDLKDALSESLVVPLFCEHFKPEMKLTFPYLTLDWVGRWRAKGNPDLISTLEVLRERAPEKNKVYYDNTIAFTEYANLDDLRNRAHFLHATAYHVVNIDKVRLNEIPICPLVLKVLNEIPHCGFILRFPPEVLDTSRELRDLLDTHVLFVKRLDYPKFVASLSDTPGTGFDLSASGVVLSVEKRHVEYLDMFNVETDIPPSGMAINIEIVK